MTSPFNPNDTPAGSGSPFGDVATRPTYPQVLPQARALAQSGDMARAQDLLQESFLPEPVPFKQAMGAVQEAFTGAKRTTPAVAEMKGYQRMPELMKITPKMLKVVAGGTLAPTTELAQIIKHQFPEVEMRQDEKGTYIFKSAVDGNEYAIKPGVTLGDLPRIAAGMVAFGKGGALRSLFTETANQATQAATGGDFDPEDIALAAAGDYLLPKVPKALFGADDVARQADDALRAARRTSVDAGDAANIPVMTSDVMPPQTFVGKSAQVAGERIPIIGSGAQRATQQTARKEAIEAIFREFGVDDTVALLDDVSADLISNRARKLSKASSIKSGILNKINGVVDVSRTTQAIDTEIGRLRALDLPKFNPIIDDLLGYRSAIQGKTAAQLDQIRASLGTAFKGDALANIADEGNKTLKRLYAPIRADIDDQVLAVGGGTSLNRLKFANSQLAEMAGELDVTALKSVLNKGKATPELIEKTLFSKKPSDVRLLYKSLTPEGQANARSAVIQRALKQSTGPEGLSPEKFLTSMKKMSAQTDILFSGPQKEQATGLLRALDLTRQASKAATHTTTGAQNYMTVSAAFLGSVLGFEGAVATAVGIGGISRVYESPPVRNALIALSRAPKGSLKETRALRAFIAATQTAKTQRENLEAQ